MKLEREVFLLTLAGLAGRERGRLDVLPRGARLHETDARPVQAHHEVEVLHRDLAGSAAAARRATRRVGLAPTPRLDVDLILVLGIGALARMPSNLMK